VNERLRGIDDFIVTGSSVKYASPIFVPYMNWIDLIDLEQLDRIDAASRNGPVLILKHSTRCGVSSAALGRLERGWTDADDAVHTAYFLDLLRYRSISDAIAERYSLEHASPQLLVIRNGRCTYSASHFGIGYTDTIEALRG
jgi:bacillithiol system protein YtxJ